MLKLRAAITFYASPESLSDKQIERLNEVLQLFDEFVEYAPEACTGFHRVLPGTFSVVSVPVPPQLDLDLHTGVVVKRLKG